MKRKEVLGLSRSRDKHGNVVKRTLNPYVNCLHTQMGGRLNMAVLVIEVIVMEEPIICAMRGRNPDNPSERAKSNGKYKQRLEMNDSGTSNTITSVQKDNLVVEPRIIEVGKVKEGKHQQDSVQHEDGICRTICTGHHASTPHLLKTMVSEPQAMTPKRTEFGKAVRKAYENKEIELSRHDMTTMEPRTDGVSNTLTSVQKDNLVATPHYRIRKLTPRECFRLMGVDDADIDKLMSAGISNSQLYKCAGNSIVVDTLYHLFRKLFIDKGCEKPSYQQTLF